MPQTRPQTRPQARPLVIAVDLGGTRLRAALVDAEGRVEARLETATRARDGADAVIEQIAQLAERVSATVPDARILGLGLCAPGPLDADAGLALATPTLKGFDDLPLRDRLEARLPYPVLLENDGLAAAYGEWRFGAGQGARHMVYVTVSTGIGGGVVADGRLLRGRQGMAGHVGHMTVDPDGPTCFCGNRGCWEALASGSALDLAGRQAGFADAAAVFAAADAGDARASALVTRTGDWLGLGLVNLMHLFSPERIVVGGGLAQGLDRLLPAISACIRTRALAPFRGIPVVRAGLGGDSGLVGAAALTFASTRVRAG